MESQVSLNEIKTEPMCPICLDEIKDISCKTECGHITCKQCIESWFNKNKDTCPLCRQTIECYHENNEKVRVIKIRDTTVSEEETQQYTLFLQALVKRLKIYKYMNYSFGLLSLYLYWASNNAYISRNEYREMYEACNTSLHEITHESEETLTYTNVLVVIGGQMIRCMLPDKYLSKCF